MPPSLLSTRWSTNAALALMRSVLVHRSGGGSSFRSVKTVHSCAACLRRYPRLREMGAGAADDEVKGIGGTGEMGGSFSGHSNNNGSSGSSSNSSGTSGGGFIRTGQKRPRGGSRGKSWTGSCRCVHSRSGSTIDSNGIVMGKTGGAGGADGAGRYMCLYRLQRRQLEFRRNLQQQHQHQQRRWARVHDVQFIKAHDRAGNGGDDGNNRKRAGDGNSSDNSTGGRKASVMDRYREKLDRKATEKGLKDISELQEAYKGQIERVRNEASRLGPAIATSLSRSNDNTDQEIKKNTTTTNASHTYNPPKGLKTLSSYLDIPKTRALPPKEIEALWRLRHAHDTQSLVATLSAKRYARMAATARRYPRFLLPIPRPVVDDEDKPSNKPAEKGEQAATQEQGHHRNQAQQEGRAGSSAGSAGTAADIHFLEWTFPAPYTTVVLFTSLAEYKLRQEYAVPHTTVSMHLELVNGADSKGNTKADGAGPVLLHATVTKGKGVSVDDARWLLMCVQRFYGGVDTGAGATTSTGTSANFCTASSSNGDSSVSSSNSDNSQHQHHNHNHSQETKLLDMFTRGDAAFDIGAVLDTVQRLG